MRVITGTARGRQLKQLDGAQTRPTTDRVKQGLFNIVQFDIPGRRVLDLFAGTGQLGIEALSRGADHCTFVELGKQAAGMVRENLQSTGLADRGTVVQGDYLSFLSGCREQFDLLFLDPPYETDQLERALERIAAIDILSDHGIIVCESTAHKQLPALEAPYQRLREYRYGTIKLTTYRRQIRVDMP